MAAFLPLVVTVAMVLAAGAGVGHAAGYTLVGWNDLGMPCMDADFAVLATLPPFNTIDAQLIDPQGNLVVDPTAAGVTVTYEAVADPNGSVNTTAVGKTNFWDHLPGLFGASLPPDVGLAGFAMPGPGNTPRPMTWMASAGWFEATGIPITPYDDASTSAGRLPIGSTCCRAAASDPGTALPSRATRRSARSRPSSRRWSSRAS